MFGTDIRALQLQNYINSTNNFSKNELILTKNQKRKLIRFK